VIPSAICAHLGWIEACTVASETVESVAIWSKCQYTLFALPRGFFHVAILSMFEEILTGKLRGPDGKHLMAEEQLAVEEVVDAVQAAYDLLRHDLQAPDGSVHPEARRDEGVVNNIQVLIFRHSIARCKLLDCRSVDKRD
jgi:hypothetical protein